jgi:hypothetical protein
MTTIHSFKHQGARPMDEQTQPPAGYFDPEHPYEPQEHRPPSMLPVLAGIFLIIAAISGFITWSQILAQDVTYFENFIPANAGISAEQVQQALQLCSIIGFVLSAITFVGGLMALKRRSWGLSLAGSILGIFTIGIAFSATIFSLIALVILFISRKEFGTQPTPPTI